MIHLHAHDIAIVALTLLGLVALAAQKDGGIVTAVVGAISAIAGVAAGRHKEATT